MSDHNELNICFICSEKYKLMVPFTEVLQTCEEFTVAEVLKYLKFLSILDTTNSHRRICLICVAKVQSCFEFKTLCAQVENMLKFHNEKSKCLENDMEDILEETPIHYFNIEHLNKEKECKGNINFEENICIVPNRGIDQPISSTINHIDSERLLQVKTEPESSEESNNQVVVEVNISSIQQQNTKRRKTAAERMKEYRIRKRNKLLMTNTNVKRKYYQWNEEDLDKALLAYEEKKLSLNKIAETYSIPKPTILRHARKSNAIAIDRNIQKGRPRVFSQDIEEILAEHIHDLESHLFGLTKDNIRGLAFEIAEKHKIPNNFNTEERMAGKKWFYTFMKRYPELSYRQSESSYLNRIKENVFNFYDTLEKIINENVLMPNNIFNVDESGFSTTQKISTLKGKMQVDITSGEPEVGMTALCCASVSGQFIPPMLTFKSMKQNPELANGAPLGSIVTVSESGFINSALFVEWLRHFIKIVKPTLENKVLLLLDGYTTHSMHLEALCLAKANGIIMLQLPGHTTNRLQPLDVPFLKPLSTHYIESTEKWLRANSGQVTQYQVTKLFGEAYKRAAVIENVVKGFKESGIWPVNRDIFPEQMFEVANN